MSALFQFAGFEEIVSGANGDNQIRRGRELAGEGPVGCGGAM